jgi:hypothetical protein
MNGKIRNAALILLCMMPWGSLFSEPYFEKRPIGSVVDVVCIVTPLDLSTRVALDVNQLEKIGSEIKIHLPSSADAVRIEFFRSLKSVVAGDPGKHLDLRFGARFYDGKGNLLHSIYIAGDKTSGVFDGEAVSDTGDFANWILDVSKH